MDNNLQDPMHHIRETEDSSAYTAAWKEQKLHFLQSWEWGETRKTNWQVKRGFVEDMPFTFLLRKYPLFNKCLVYMPGLFTSDSISQSKLEAVITYITANYKISHIVIESNIVLSEDEVELSNAQEISKVFKSTNMISTDEHIQPRETDIIKLEASEEELLKRIKQKSRNEINRSVRSGCIVKVYSAGDEALEKFNEVLKYILANTDYSMPGFEYFKNIWSNLSVVGMCEILLATNEEGALLGGYFMVYDEVGAYHLYGGVNDIGRKHEAGYALKWESIKRAKFLGKLNYDQWGVAPRKGGDYQEGHPLYHISRFKAGFGGDYVQFVPTQVYVADKMLYRFYTMRLSAQRLIIKLKNLMKKK